MGGFLSLLSVSSCFSKDGAVCCGSVKKYQSSFKPRSEQSCFSLQQTNTWGVASFMTGFRPDP